MQARIADIIEKAKQMRLPGQQAPAAPPRSLVLLPAQGLQEPYGALAQRPPSLMDHIIAQASKRGQDSMLS